jgi:sialidase-1
MKTRVCWLASLVCLAVSLTTVGFAVPVTQTDVFISGEGGYHTYRIPAILRAANGDLLAFCEGRKGSGGDSGDIDLLLKRSNDSGKSWGGTQVVWNDGANTCGNPCPVLDETTGVIWLLLTHNLGSDHERDIVAGKSQGTRTVWITHSDDNGATWAAPLDITASTKDSSWSWYATGPGIGIQLKRGAHAGRLVIPCDHKASAENGAHAIYSDDHGKTWRRGAPIRPGVNECQVVELADERGTLLMNLRSDAGRNVRAQATSVDGGETWSAPNDAPPLIEPVCQASILRHASGLLLFSNPAAKTRTNLLVRSSADDGKSWNDIVVLAPGPAAYSCLVSLSSTEAGCLYERGDKRAYEKITFARFTVAK